ncbi:hypothetical protein LOZ39_005168 [Ophidiomyces ophidiicola]|nr:hypothetical protein LOZ61_005543 [Ophidiomyces ophidiicola]KAI1922853.1 hypothetical protein LOZ60_005512 [Ophidiomyces ophidiicola]KAI2002341.1 hypothetical protein LOZ50_005034 [Ophidiomyces ophidiicola]KAI2008768.1 hypothetical protein LOZ49_004177 [Ophidiomyces ophidiicola]KAI2019272.1 hypothetical protein LOZ45_005600 [Ophidiomyces ophidiicola]
MSSDDIAVNYISGDADRRYPGIPIENIISAAIVCTDILDAHYVPYAVCGDFAVWLLQGKREVLNVDILFQGRKEHVRSIMETGRQQQRWGNTLAILVQTGPGYDMCEDKITIKVNLIDYGYQNGDLTNKRLISRVETLDGCKPMYILGIFDIVNAKLCRFNAEHRIEDKDDLLFLMQRYPEKIGVRVKELHRDAVVAFIQSIPEEIRTELETEILYYKIEGISPSSHRGLVPFCVSWQEGNETVQSPPLAWGQFLGV